MAKQKRTTVRRSKKTVTSGIVHIQSTFNNTIVSVTDDAGNTSAQLPLDPFTIATM